MLIKLQECHHHTQTLQSWESAAQRSSRGALAGRRVVQDAPFRAEESEQRGETRKVNSNSEVKVNFELLLAAVVVVVVAGIQKFQSFSLHLSC